MTDDTIYRQAAIEALDEIRHALWEIDIPSPTVSEYVEHHEQVQSVWKLLDKKQKELYVLPSAQPEPQWIPCSEKLPKEEKKTYWVCTDTEYQCECRWTNNRFGFGEGEWGWSIFDTPQYSKPIAWMPLPYPYQPERRKENRMSRYGDADYDDMAYELDEFLKKHRPSELLKLVQDAVEWWEEKKQ